MIQDIKSNLSKRTQIVSTCARMHTQSLIQLTAVTRIKRPCGLLGEVMTIKTYFTLTIKNFHILSWLTTIYYRQIKNCCIYKTKRMVLGQSSFSRCKTSMPNVRTLKKPRPYQSVNRTASKKPPSQTLQIWRCISTNMPPCLIDTKKRKWSHKR